MKKKSIRMVHLAVLLFLIAGILAILFPANILGTTLLTVQAASSSSVPQMLSQMTNEECVEFVTENGIEIPNELQEISELGAVVKNIIGILENNPNHEFLYSNPEMLKFAKNIKSVVNDYRNGRETASVQHSVALAAYVLQDSTVVGSWSDSYEKYNCYAYAINKTDKFHQPGENSGITLTQSLIRSLSVSQLANYVKSDLENIGGYGSVYVSSVRPQILSQNETLICIRKTTTTDLASTDYHFMKYSNGSWYHKPSWTAILKYTANNGEPSNNKAWTNENSRYDSSYAGTIVYDSEIYYIVYNWSGLTIQGTTVTGFTPQSGFNGSLVIPDGVTAIGTSAFANQTQMAQITIPSSVVDMGSGAFLGCNNLNITVQGASVGLKWTSGWNSNRPVSFTVAGGCGLSHSKNCQPNNLFNHTVFCTNCSATVIENHAWMPIDTTNSRCPTCKLVAETISIPIILNRIPIDIQNMLIEFAAKNGGYAYLHLDNGMELYYIDGQFYLIEEHEDCCDDELEEHISAIDLFYDYIERYGYDGAMLHADITR